MAGKLITQQQQRHIAAVMTALIAALDVRGGANWSKKVTDDIQLAYRMLGVPCPFTTEAVVSDEQQPARTGLLGRVLDSKPVAMLKQTLSNATGMLTARLSPGFRWTVAALAVLAILWALV